MISDRELFDEYATSASQVAFAELVRRNADLVYVAARRQVRDSHLAEDVTQAVFLLLAKKAGGIRGPLEGWLIQTTWYVAQNAKRLALIRQRHEGEVAEMNSRQSSESSVPATWDAYSEYVDEAMARLRTADRAAISLRFLKGLDLPEVAAAMGISPEAARKRVERSMAKLREITSARAAVPAAGVLGAQLAAKGAEVAPAKLVATIVSGGGAVKGTLGSVLASGASRAMVWAKVKIAAAVLLTGGLAGGGAGVVAQLAGSASAGKTPQKLTTASAASAAPAAAATAEMQVPGEMQVVQWDVLLDDHGAALVSGLGRPVQTQSRVYVPRICSGEQLRAAVAQAIANPAATHVSHDMQFVDFSRGRESYWGMHQLYFRYESGANADRFWFAGASHTYTDNFTRTDSNHLRVQIDHPDVSAGPAEGKYGNLRFPPGGEAICFDGQLAAGEAVAFLARLPGASGRNYHHLVVWETFKARPEQFAVINGLRNAGWWCQKGPQTLRAWADAARVWMADTRDNRNNTRLEKKLDDGVTIYLSALSRPSKWPACWWDPQGKPVGLTALLRSADGEPSEGLWAVLDVQMTQEQLRSDWSKPVQPSDKARVYDNNAHQISEAGPIEVGIPVGGWEEIARVKIGQSAVAENVTFRVENTKNDSFVRFDQTGRINDQYCLILVAKDGSRSDATGHFQRAPLKWGRDTVSGTVNDSIDVLPLPSSHKISVAERDYCIVMRRKRQWVTFEGFAVNPSPPPPTSVTNAQADAKETQVRQQWDDQLRRNRIASNREHRKSWDAIAADPKTHLGSLKVLIQTAQKGDTAGVRKLLSMPEPQSDELLNSMARVLVLSESIRTKAVAAFGPDAADGDLSPTDFGPQMAGMPWTKTQDGAYRDPNHMYTLRPGTDGRFLLEIDCLNDKDQVKNLKLMVAKFEALDQLLRKDPPPTLQQAKAAMEAAGPR